MMTSTTSPVQITYSHVFHFFEAMFLLYQIHSRFCAFLLFLMNRDFYKTENVIKLVDLCPGNPMYHVECI